MPAAPAGTERPRPPGPGLPCRARLAVGKTARSHLDTAEERWRQVRRRQTPPGRTGLSSNSSSTRHARTTRRPASRRKRTWRRTGKWWPGSTKCGARRYASSAGWRAATKFGRGWGRLPHGPANPGARGRREPHRARRLGEAPETAGRGCRGTAESGGAGPRGHAAGRSGEAEIGSATQAILRAGDHFTSGRPTEMSHADTLFSEATRHMAERSTRRRSRRPAPHRAGPGGPVRSRGDAPGGQRGTPRAGSRKGSDCGRGGEPPVSSRAIVVGVRPDKQPVGGKPHAFLQTQNRVRKRSPNHPNRIVFNLECGDPRRTPNSNEPRAGASSRGRAQARIGSIFWPITRACGRLVWSWTIVSAGTPSR